MSTASTTALTVATRPCFVYEAIDPDTNVPFYVGRTGNLERRASEHQKRCMTKIRELLKLKNFRFRDVQRRVPELPDGCASEPPEHAQELEAYFIFERKVVYDPVTCPWGCNSRIGDHGSKMTPERFAELKRMFAEEGYSYPLVGEPKEVRDARAEHEIATSLTAMATQSGDKKTVDVLNECKVLAKRALLDVEQTHLGTRAFVERVLVDYEDSYVDAVDQQTLQTALNLIKDKMNDDAAYHDLTSIVKTMSLVCKEKEGVEVSSEAAANGLKMVLAMITSREEATLTWTHKHVETNMKAVRTWTRSHGMRKPMPTLFIDDKEEKRCANFLRHWKQNCDSNGGTLKDIAACRVLMRGICWFEDYVRIGDKKRNDWRELNKQLRGGYAWTNEPEFDGKRLCPKSKDNVSVYQRLECLVRGQGKPDDVATALEGLPPSRSEWYKAQYSAKREAALEKSKSTYYAHMKRKRDATASALDSERLPRASGHV
tara:strand:- start:108 stop:1568 length:1461 start_codon:yes stop_codon:yes gene_type:complete